MTVTASIDAARLIEEQLAQASPDLLRELLTSFINTLMSAEADAVCGAAYGVSSPERTNRRSGYRPRDFDTRTGTLELEIPKLRAGTYFPQWLLERRKRAERALTSVVATCYLLGVSTRRMDKLVQSLGITTLSKSQVPEMAKDLDSHVDQFRSRRLDDAGPFTFVAADALVLKVREGGRVVPVHALVATGVDADGHRQILGVQVTTSEDGAGWLAFFRDLTARGLTGVRLVTSDAHSGLVAAISATLPGAAWQRCRTHYAANLMATTPKSSWPWVKALLHSVYDQPDAAAVHAQFDRIVDALASKLPAVAEHLETARPSTTSPTRTPSTPSSTGSSTPWPASSRPSPSTSRPHGPTSWRSPASPKRSGDRSGRTTPTNASTSKSDAAPTSSASSPTGHPSSDSPAPSWPNNTTNGPKHGATSDSTSWPNPEPTTPRRRPTSPSCKP